MKNIFLCMLIFSAVVFRLAPGGYCQAPDNQSEIPLRLQLAAMCEDIRDFSPVNQSVVFSVGAGKVFCFNYFNPVPGKTHIFHTWYHYDKIITKRKLSLDAPYWKTYSSIQLREDDKGPWRVEITDRDNKRLKILRFSVTD